MKLDYNSVAKHLLPLWWWCAADIAAKEGGKEDRKKGRRKEGEKRERREGKKKGRRERRRKEGKKKEGRRGDCRSLVQEHIYIYLYIYIYICTTFFSSSESQIPRKPPCMRISWCGYAVYVHFSFEASHFESYKHWQVSFSGKKKQDFKRKRKQFLWRIQRFLDRLPPCRFIFGGQKKHHQTWWSIGFGHPKIGGI